MATRNAKMSRPKDAIAKLHADHHKVRQLFRTYQAARDPTTQWEIARQVFDELEVHAQLEEVVFSQAVEEETTSLGKRLVHASLEEHQEALALIQALRGLVPGLPEFDTTFQALVLTVEHHMAEEEREMFPLAAAGHCQLHETSLTDAFLVRKADGVQVAKIEGDVKEENQR